MLWVHGLGAIGTWVGCSGYMGWVLLVDGLGVSIHGLGAIGRWLGVRGIWGGFYMYMGWVSFWVGVILGIWVGPCVLAMCP